MAFDNHPAHPELPEEFPVAPAVRPASAEERGWRTFWQRKAPAAAAATLLLAGVVAGGGVTYGYMQAKSTAPLTIGSSTAPAGQTVAYNPPSGITQLYQQAVPSIVKITQSSQVQTRRGTQSQEGVGTGIVVDKQGDILTNNHVIASGGTIQVDFQNGKSVQGTVVGTDPGDDLAVVKVNPSGLNLQPAVLGDSSQVQIGQQVVAIGNPFGDYTWSISSGIISGEGRSLQTDSGRTVKNLFQTDAAINPGNSGGPLLDMSGRVIGINTAIQSPVAGNVGIGFAIPSNLAQSVLSTLEKGGQVQHPWVGLGLAQLTPDIASQNKLGIDHGVIMPADSTTAGVYPGSPAEKAGLQPTTTDANGQLTLGDVITGVDTVTVNQPDDLIGYVNTKQVGDTVIFHVWRGGKTVDVPVTLAAWPAQLNASQPQ